PGRAAGCQEIPQSEYPRSGDVGREGSGRGADKEARGQGDKEKLSPSDPAGPFKAVPLALCGREKAKGATAPLPAKGAKLRQTPSQSPRHPPRRAAQRPDPPHAGTPAAPDLLRRSVRRQGAPLRTGGEIGRRGPGRHLT